MSNTDKDFHNLPEDDNEDQDCTSPQEETIIFLIWPNEEFTLHHRFNNGPPNRLFKNTSSWKRSKPNDEVTSGAVSVSARFYLNGTRFPRSLKKRGEIKLQRSRTVDRTTEFKIKHPNAAEKCLFMGSPMKKCNPPGRHLKPHQKNTVHPIDQNHIDEYLLEAGESGRGTNPSQSPKDANWKAESQWQDRDNSFHKEQTT